MRPPPHAIAELLGSFVLVFCGTIAIETNVLADGAIGHLGISVAFGLVVMVMIYAVGDFSGAHINPAVTLAFAIAGRLPWARVPGYISMQLVGACMASALVWFLTGNATGLGPTVPRELSVLGLVRAGVLEIIFSWILMGVILGVSTGAKEKGIVAAVAVGGAVLLLALVGGPLTGASMNPARSLGPALVGGDPSALATLPLYIIAPIIGTAAAVITWNWLQTEPTATGDTSSDANTNASSDANGDETADAPASATADSAA